MGMLEWLRCFRVASYDEGDFHVRMSVVSRWTSCANAFSASAFSFPIDHPQDKLHGLASR